MMDVLIYLFESYIDYNETELVLEQEYLSQELIDIGFRAQDVQRAFEWLEDLADDDADVFHFLSPVNHASNTLDRDNINVFQRVYTKEERSRLSDESIALLQFLEQGRLISALQREYILSYVIKLEEKELSLDQFKWLMLMVLFNAPDSEEAYELLDQYFYDSETLLLH